MILRKHTIRKNTIIVMVFYFILTAVALSCHRRQEPCTDTFFAPTDSVFRMAEDSIYVNPLLSRRLLLESMDGDVAADSIDWYLRYNLYIKTFLVTSELDSVQVLCSKTHQYCTRQHPPSRQTDYLLSEMYNNLGNRYSIASMNDSAISCFGNMLDYARLTASRELQITATNNLADSYVRNGDFGLGAHYYRQALLVSDSFNLPKQEMITTYTGLGQTYMELRDFDLSHHYYNQAYQLFDQMDLNRKFVYFVNHGNVYYFEEKYPEALALFKEGYALVQSSPEYAYAQNLCMLNMGEVYMLMGALDSAQYYLDQSYGYFKQIGNQSALYHAETQRLELALKEGNIAVATRILKEEKKELRTEPSLASIRRKHLQHYYEEVHDYQKAYQYLKENLQMDDSIRNDRIRMRVAEIDLRYKQDTTLIKQELFIQQQQSDMKTMEQSIFIWILTCIIILIIAIFIYIYQKKQRAYLLVQTRNKMIGLRMENIRNRISPHFTFNVLNRVISRYKETDNEYRDLHNLIKMMRLNLGLTQKLCITLEEELDFVRTYLELEQQQVGTSLQIEIELAPEIDASQFCLPSMMIQIPVENAIKHGLRAKEGDKRLHISVSKDQGRIEICIDDNGTGFFVNANRQNPQSTGTGLKVLNQTIQLLNATNAEPISLSIGNRTGQRGEIIGCSVRFSIPEHYSYMLPDDQ